MTPRRMALAAKLFRGLGDPSRLKVLSALRDGPLSVGAIVERSGLSQPNASMHLACLGECGLVSKERAGRFVYYDLADKRVARLLDDGEDLLLRVEAAIEACGRYSEPRTRSRSRGRARR